MTQELWFEQQLRRAAQRRPCCSQCGSVLFAGEVYYDLGSPVCRDCVAQVARRLFRQCRRQVPAEVEL